MEKDSLSMKSALETSGEEDSSHSRKYKLKSKSRSFSNEKLWAWGFLSPSILLYSIYVIIPILGTFLISFTYSPTAEEISLVPACIEYEGISCLFNYETLFADEEGYFWKSFWNTILWIAAFSFAPPLGLAIALFFHVKGFMATVYKSLFFMPMVLSLVVVGYIWSWFFLPQNGALEFLAHSLGILAPGEHVNILGNERWANFGVIIANMWPQVAYCMILYLAGLSNLRKNVIESALIDGVNKFQMLFNILLPMLRPATVIAYVVSFIGALRCFDMVAVMTKGGPANATNVLGYLVYEKSNKGEAAAIAVVIFALSMLIVLYHVLSSRKMEV